MVAQVINFLTELKVRGDLFLERKPVVRYHYFSYFARFQGAQDLGKSALWGISSSCQAQQPRCSGVCGRLCLWPGGCVAESTRCFCSMWTGTLCPKIKPCKETLLCNAKSSWCRCGPAKQGQPFVLQAAFPCTCSVCLCKLMVSQGYLGRGPHRSLGCRWVKVAEQHASLF